MTDEKFLMSPVGESSEDPVTGMEIYPDFDVQFGDGVNSFGGRGSDRKENVCNVHPNMPDQECVFEESYRWELRRTKKKDN